MFFSARDTSTFAVLNTKLINNEKKILNENSNSRKFNYGNKYVNEYAYFIKEQSKRRNQFNYRK